MISLLWTTISILVTEGHYTWLTGFSRIIKWEKVCKTPGSELGTWSSLVTFRFPLLAFYFPLYKPVIPLSSSFSLSFLISLLFSPLFLSPEVLLPKYAHIMFVCVCVCVFYCMFHRLFHLFLIPVPVTISLLIIPKSTAFSKPLLLHSNSYSPLSMPLHLPVFLEAPA